MGHHHSLNLHESGKRAANKFDDEELHVLRETFKDLAERSNGDSVNKETFLRFLPFPGLFGGLKLINKLFV